MLPWEFSEEYVMCLNHLILNFIPFKSLITSSFFCLGNIAHKEDVSVLNFIYFIFNFFPH